MRPLIYSAIDVASGCDVTDDGGVVGVQYRMNRVKPRSGMGRPVDNVLWPLE